MTGTDKIHETQEKVGKLQAQLERVQRMLGKAEKVAASAEAAERRAARLLGASIALVAVGILLLVRSRRKKRGG